MVKFYGADMFSIPKMLREMDPDRVETFRSIYGRHLAVAMRHIEELRELEKELFHKYWSSALEETLIPQLPWPEKELNQYSAPEAKGQKSPFPIIVTLASLVAVRLGDFALLQSIGGSLLSSGARPDLQREAALQISNWRVAGNTYLEGLRYPAMDALRRAPEPRSVLVTLSQVYLGERDVEVPKEALNSDDPEVSFFAALLLRNEPTLIRALDSVHASKWMVAANMLISLHRADTLVDVFGRRADADQQMRMLSQISLEKHPVPELHEALFDTIRRNPKTKLARNAASAICLGCTHTEAMRLAEMLDWDILHSLSLSKRLEPETFRAIGELLVRENKVAMHQFTWTCLAAPGRMPQDFVERVFPMVDTPDAQIGLLSFAEKQLDDLPERPRGTSMEGVLIRAAFGDHAPEVIGAAWAGMHRINYRRDYGSPSPFPYSIETIEQYWPFLEFEERLARLQANKAALKQTFVAEEIRRFLGSRA